MSEKIEGIDNRGSKLQQFIYDLAMELYPHYPVRYEYLIPELNQRIDIFIPALGIALEIHGEQHYVPNSFFFKDELAWNKSILLDNTKSQYLSGQGVKLVEIPFNSKIKTKEDLKEAIDSVDYPNAEYEYIEQVSQSKKDFLERQRQYRKELYKKMKSKNGNSKR